LLGKYFCSLGGEHLSASGKVNAEIHVNEQQPEDPLERIEKPGLIGASKG
jgi:hypothetical protein